MVVQLWIAGVVVNTIMEAWLSFCTFSISLGCSINWFRWFFLRSSLWADHVSMEVHLLEAKEVVVAIMKAWMSLGAMLVYKNFFSNTTFILNYFLNWAVRVIGVVCIDSLWLLFGSSLWADHSSMKVHLVVTSVVILTIMETWFFTGAIAILV
jgi:hypothetical protein